MRHVLEIQYFNMRKHEGMLLVRSPWICELYYEERFISAYSSVFTGRLGAKRSFKALRSAVSHICRVALCSRSRDFILQPECGCYNGLKNNTSRSPWRAVLIWIFPYNLASKLIISIHYVLSFIQGVCGRKNGLISISKSM